MLELLQQVFYANLILIGEVVSIGIFLVFVWLIFLALNQIKEELFMLIGKVKPTKKKKKILNESGPTRWEQR